MPGRSWRRASSSRRGRDRPHSHRIATAEPPRIILTAFPVRSAAKALDRLWKTTARADAVVNLGSGSDALERSRAGRRGALTTRPDDPERPGGASKGERMTPVVAFSESAGLLTLGGRLGAGYVTARIDGVLAGRSAPRSVMITIRIHELACSISSRVVLETLDVSRGRLTGVRPRTREDPPPGNISVARCRLSRYAASQDDRTSVNTVVPRDPREAVLKEGDIVGITAWRSSRLTATPPARFRSAGSIRPERLLEAPARRSMRIAAARPGAAGSASGGVESIDVQRLWRRPGVRSPGWHGPP